MISGRVRMPLAMAILVTSTIRAAESPEDIKRRLCSELPAASQRYAARLRLYQCESECIGRNLGNGAVVFKHRTSSRQMGESGLFVIEPDATISQDPSEARVINSRYVFVLRKKPNSDWVLHDFHEVTQGHPSSIYYAGLNQMARGPYSLDPTTWLPESVQQPEFVISGTTDEDREGRKLVRIKYEYTKPNQTPTYSGHMLFDPDRYWLMMELEHTTSTAKGSLTNRSIYEYVENDGFPLMSRAVTVQSSTRFPQLSSESTTSVRYVREDAHESEFTLSAFGLPEPIGVRWKHRTPRFVYLLAGAGVFLALSVALYWLGHRNKSKS